MKANVVLHINGDSYPFKSTEQATAFLFKYNSRIKDQKKLVKKHLLKHGKISRNQCLAVFITRLSSIINILNSEGMDIEGDYGTNGVDYIYRLKG